MKAVTRTIFIASMAALAVSCAGKKNAQEAAPVEMQAVVTNVEVYTTRYEDVPQTEVYSTNIQAYAVNNVVPQSGSRIKKINVEVGDFVSKGQILAEMDQTTLQQTKMKLDNDAVELARLKELYESGALSKSDYDAAQLAFNVSSSQYENLSENAILRSPISGVITARNYDAGDMYAMSSPIYVVQQITPVKLLVAMSETDYSKIDTGDVVEITTDALADKQFTGKINRIYPTIDPATHTVTVEISVPNNDRVLRPGMFARVKVTFGINHSIVIPDVAVVKQQGSGQKMAFIVNGDNTVTSRMITLGRHFGNMYEVLNGLDEGERIVSRGHTALRSGDEVNVIREEAL